MRSENAEKTNVAQRLVHAGASHDTNKTHFYMMSVPCQQTSSSKRVHVVNTHHFCFISLWCFLVTVVLLIKCLWCSSSIEGLPILLHFPVMDTSCWSLRADLWGADANECSEGRGWTMAVKASVGGAWDQECSREGLSDASARHTQTNMFGAEQLGGVTGSSGGDVRALPPLLLSS